MGSLQSVTLLITVLSGSVYVDFVRNLPFILPRKVLLLHILNSLGIWLRTALMRLVPSTSVD